MSRFFQLSSSERSELRSLLRGRKEDGLVVRRAYALLLLDKGWSCAKIADALFTDCQTIRGWCQAYEAKGFGSLALALALPGSV